MFIGLVWPRSVGFAVVFAAFLHRMLGMDDNRRVERRNRQPGESPMTILKELPALVVLERVPVPALAIVQDGTILFANTAFAEMLGYTAGAVRSLSFGQIFQKPRAADSVMSTVHALSNMIVELAHSDGSTVRALMSRSVLARSDDPIALVTFQDLTEHLWVNGS